MFANAGSPQFFLSSADWMPRNLDRRVEVTFPVYDPRIQRQLARFLEIQWRDNVKARVLDPTLSNGYRPRRGKEHRSQMELLDYIQRLSTSPAGRGGKVVRLEKQDKGLRAAGSGSR